MKSLKRRSSALAVAAVMGSLLSACGGGGGGPGASATVDISGVASKGLIKRGKVSAYGINANGTKTDTPVAAAVNTDDNGGYTLKGVPAGTAVLIEITPDTNTKVIDENTGNEYSPSADFKLRAAINTVTGGTNTAIVTPYSEMAVTRALASTGGLDKKNIDLANQYVGDATGVVINSKDSAPQFAKDGKTPLNSTAAKLVAIAKMADPNDKSVDACKDKTALADKTTCVINALSTAANGNLDSSAGLGKVLNDKLKEVKDANKSTTEVANAPEISSGTTTGGSSTATQSPIEQVKAFFASLRSNAKALKDTSGGTAPTLYTKLQAIQTDLQTRATPLKNYADNTITLIAKAHGLLQDAQKGSGVYGQRWYKSSFTSNGTTYYWDPIGGCQVYTSQDLTTVATTAANAQVVACTTAGNQADLYRYATMSTPANGAWTFTRTETVTGITLAPTAGTANSYAVSSATFRRTVAATVANGSYPSASGQDYVEDKTKRRYLSADSATNSGYQANVTLTKDDSGKITAIAWSGDMASSYDDAGAVFGKKHQINLNAQLNTLDANTQKLSMAGDISLIDTNDQLVSKLSLDAGSYVTASNNQNGQDEMLLKLSLRSPEWVIQGSLTGSQFSKDKQGLNYEPTQVAFTGAVKDSSGAEFFSGSITGQRTGYANFDKSLPQSTTNFTPATGRITGTVSIAGRPTLSVELTGNNSAFDTVSGTFTYKQGNDPSVTGTVQHAASSTTSSYTLANTQGVGMKWSSSDTTASLTKNDVTLGTWNFNSGRLTYIDGTYEQF